MAYYVSRIMVGIAMLTFIGCIVMGIIAVWSTGPNVDKIGGTAGILGGATFVLGLVGGLTMVETRKPYRAPKQKKDRF